jgi:hypothetical protein
MRSKKSRKKRHPRTASPSKKKGSSSSHPVPSSSHPLSAQFAAFHQTIKELCRSVRRIEGIMEDTYQTLQQRMAERGILDKECPPSLPPAESEASDAEEEIPVIDLPFDKGGNPSPPSLGSMLPSLLKNLNMKQIFSILRSPLFRSALPQLKNILPQLLRRGASPISTHQTVQRRIRPSSLPRSRSASISKRSSLPRRGARRR